MSVEYSYGCQIYHVPKFDARLARYLPVTRVRLSSKPPIVVLGHHIVISPERKANGSVARDRVGSFWVSKEAYEAYLAWRAQPVWRRYLWQPCPAGRKGRKRLVDVWNGLMPSWLRQ